MQHHNTLEHFKIQIQISFSRRTNFLFIPHRKTTFISYYINNIEYREKEENYWQKFSEFAHKASHVVQIRRQVPLE